MKNNIVLPCGTVVGTGKLKVFVSNSFPHEIPTLSFTVAKDTDGMFTASCIQLMIEGDGETSVAAIKSMRERVLYFLEVLFTNENTKDFAWDNLHELYNNSISNEYWKAYRDMQLNLAETGVCTDTKKAHIDEIAKLKRRIIELEKVVGYPHDYELDAEIVEYQEIAA